MASKLTQVRTEALEDMEMDVSPMIDLVFLLLIFFMVSSHLIVVQLDPEVKPPIAESAKSPENALGRIVVNIRKDGSVWDVSKELAGPEEDLGDLQAYIGELADNYRSNGDKPRLHVRADRDVDVKRIKEVVQASADSQVIDIIFASYVSEGAASMAE